MPKALFRLLRHLIAASGAFVLAASGPAFSQHNVPSPHALDAGPPRAVIELFTSQGCGDCPEADALLKSLAQKDDIIALTLPVDYWDYLGWKDTLASPRNAERQRAYAERLGSGTVFTPQAVVNGSMEVLGSDEAEIDRAVRATEAVLSSSRIPVKFWHFGSTIIIEAGGLPIGSEAREATIWLAVVQRSVNVSIKSGENAGKSLTYYNVVREFTPVGVWHGRPATIRLARAAIMRPESEDLVVLIQEESNGRIIGAARMGD